MSKHYFGRRESHPYEWYLSKSLLPRRFDDDCWFFLLLKHKSDNLQYLHILAPADSAMQSHPRDTSAVNGTIVTVNRGQFVWWCVPYSDQTFDIPLFISLWAKIHDIKHILQITNPTFRQMVLWGHIHCDLNWESITW